MPAQIANAAFTSVSCRTAGFNSFDLAAAEQITQLVMIILMFIGASPLSTGGGIKSTTFFIILMSMWAVFRGRNETVIFGRRIPRELRDQAFAIFTMGTIWVVTAGVLLSAIDGEVHELETVIFETVSGFGTVGMGIGITSNWDVWGKLVLTLTMLVGRVGIMTFMVSLITQKETRIKYPPERDDWVTVAFMRASRYTAYLKKKKRLSTRFENIGRYNSAEKQIEHCLKVFVRRLPNGYQRHAEE